MIKAGQAVAALGYDEDAPVEELLEKAEKEIFHITQTFLKDSFMHIKDVLNARYERFAELHEAKDDEKFKGVPTGLTALDNRLSGLQAGLPPDFIWIAVMKRAYVNILTKPVCRHRKISR